MSSIELTVLILIIQGIPEQIALITFGCAIAKLPFKWKEIVAMGIVMALAARIIRSVAFLPFGLHTIVLLLMLFLYLVISGKTEVSLALIASIGSFFALIIYEVVSVTIMTELTQISRGTWYTNESLRILFGYPHIILLFVTAFIVRKKRGIA